MLNINVAIRIVVAAMLLFLKHHFLHTFSFIFHKHFSRSRKRNYTAKLFCTENSRRNNVINFQSKMNKMLQICFQYKMGVVGVGCWLVFYFHNLFNKNWEKQEDLNVHTDVK